MAQSASNRPLDVLPSRQADRLDPRAFDAYALRIRDQASERALANRDGELRLGRLLAWLKRQDLAPLGWPGFWAFCRENVELSETRIRQLVRLAEAALPGVHAAVRRGEITLSAALDAVRDTTPEHEAEWLDAHRRGLHRRPSRADRTLHHADPDDVAAVHASRGLARVVTGRRYSDAQADRFVMDSFELGDPTALLEAARTPPPAPPPLAPLPGDPESAEEALRQLSELQRDLRLRELWLGQLYCLVREQHLVWAMGFDTLEQFARWLGVSQRSIEDYAVLAENVALHPELGEALARGLSMQKVRLVADLVEPSTVAAWVALAEQVPAVELERATRWAEAEGAAVVLEAYAEAVAVALEDDPRNRVALRQSQDPEPVPRSVRVTPEQVTAARWFVKHVEIPPRHGCGRAVERDDFVCQNPRCGKRCLRNQAHHLVWRSRGGSDALANLITVCPGCHLRGIHSGWMHVTRMRRGWLWRFVGGDRVFVVDAAPSEDDPAIPLHPTRVTEMGRW